MATLTIYNTDGTVHSPRGESGQTNPRIESFAVAGVRLTIEPEANRVIGYIRAQPTAAARAEQFYAAYTTDDLSNPLAKFYDAVTSQLATWDYTVADSADDMATFRAIGASQDQPVPGSKQDREILRTIADTNPTASDSVTVGVSDSTAAVGLLQTLAEEYAVVISDKQATDALSAFDIAITPGHQSGIQPLGQTATQWTAAVEEQTTDATVSAAADRIDLRLLLPEQLRRLPADLAAVVVLTLLTIGAVSLPGIRETSIRILLGLPFVLFLPGYAFIAALFPEAGDSPERPSEATESIGNATQPPASDDPPTGDGDDAQRSGIDGIERVALAFGTSIAIVPLIGLVLNFTPWGIRLAPIVISVSGFTLIASGVAARRRWALPAEERFVVPYQEWITTGRTEIFEPESQVDAALNVLLVLSVLLAVGSVGYAVAVPPQGEQFTEFYLLTEDDDGELVADNYPTTFVQGESQSVIVGIGNNEYEPTNYTVVVQLQEVETVTRTNVTAANESTVGNETRVLNREQVDRFSAQVAHNETRQQRRPVTPTITGENLRLQYLLYTDEVPAEPTAENAYRSLHLWVAVEDSN